VGLGPADMIVRLVVVLAIVLAHTGCNKAETVDAPQVLSSISAEDLENVFTGSGDYHERWEYLSGVVYFDNLTEEALSTLDAVWGCPKECPEEWDSDFAGHSITQILIAESLIKNKSSRRSELTDFLRNQVGSPEADIRANAALGLGRVGDESDIDLLAGLVRNDRFIVSLQAAYALLSMESDSATDALTAELGILKVEQPEKWELLNARIAELI
jgi:HEAT repeat protein